MRYKIYQCLITDICSRHIVNQHCICLEQLWLPRVGSCSVAPLGATVNRNKSKRTPRFKDGSSLLWVFPAVFLGQRITPIGMQIGSRKRTVESDEPERRQMLRT